jgi:DNA-binding NtrC family response regulator
LQRPPFDVVEVLGINPSTLYRKLGRYEEQVEVKT